MCYVYGSVADVVSEKLSSTETSVATSAVGRVASPVLGALQSCALNPAPSAQEQRSKPQQPSLCGGSVLSLTSGAEGTKKITYRNLIALEHSGVSRVIFLFLKSDTRSEKCKFESEMLSPKKTFL